MPIAIHEDLLKGRHIAEKFAQARALGVEGIELAGASLTTRVPEIAQAMADTGLKIAAVNYGRQGTLVSPDGADREKALAKLRQTIVNATDLGAAGVVFTPHFGEAILPDLSPWMTAAELETELFYTHMRTLEDYAYALGTELFVEPVCRDESHLLNRLDQVAVIARRLNHPHVKISANVRHMALEEADMVTALREQADLLGFVHVSDPALHVKAVADALDAMGYHGWVCMYESPDNLADSLYALRQTGLT